MNCPDCEADGRAATLVFDAKQAGEVCPRCLRVFSPNLPLGNLHFATREAALAAMRIDQAAARHKSESTKALVQRIMRPID